MSLTELNEEDLLQRAGRGEVRAFERLYDLLAPRMFGLLRQMLHDEREAEDVLQAGFVQLWDRASGFGPERGSAFTWAVVIFRQTAIERMRALGRRNRLVESADLQNVTLAPQADEGLGGLVLASERDRAVREAFDGLPDDQRQLIEFALLKGLTHHVLAESLGIDPATVKTNISRGLLRLNDLLKGGA